MQIQRPTDLDLHCLQRQHISGFSRTRINYALYYTHTNLPTSLVSALSLRFVHTNVLICLTLIDAFADLPRPMDTTRSFWKKMVVVIKLNGIFISSVVITKTCLYNTVPLKPHFYIVKLGFTGVYISFLISAQKHRLWVLVRTASSRRF